MKTNLFKLVDKKYNELTLKYNGKEKNKNINDFVYTKRSEI